MEETAFGIHDVIDFLATFSTGVRYSANLNTDDSILLFFLHLSETFERSRSTWSLGLKESTALPIHFISNVKRRQLAMSREYCQSTNTFK